MITVVAYGGGTNSVALLLLMIAKKEPAPHAILMGDTGGENPLTYSYRDMFSTFIQKYGYPPIQNLRRARRDKMWQSLEDDCLRLGVLPSVAYGWKTCSQKFKVEPQDKYLNNDTACKEAWKSGQLVTKIIGYDYGEIQRARFGSDEKYLLRYPLIEWKLTRSHCQWVIQRVGLPLPGKSACFFCPHSKKHEIITLAEKHPELAARAVAMERNAAPNLRKVKGLGRNFSWQDVLKNHDFEAVEDPYDEIPCGCYDG